METQDVAHVCTFRADMLETHRRWVIRPVRSLVEGCQHPGKATHRFYQLVGHEVALVVGHYRLKVNRLRHDEGTFRVYHTLDVVVSTNRAKKQANPRKDAHHDAASKPTLLTPQVFRKIRL